MNWLYLRGGANTTGVDTLEIHDDADAAATVAEGLLTATT